MKGSVLRVWMEIIKMEKKKMTHPPFNEVGQKILLFRRVVKPFYLLMRLAKPFYLFRSLVNHLLGGSTHSSF